MVEVERQVAVCFLTTARCASFKQAARSLNLPPMVLRRQLQRLEKSIGDALFIYQKRALVLTIRGRSLRDELVARYQDLRAEAGMLGAPSPLPGGLIIKRLAGHPQPTLTLFWTENRTVQK